MTTINEITTTLAKVTINKTSNKLKPTHIINRGTGAGGSNTTKNG